VLSFYFSVDVVGLGGTSRDNSFQEVSGIEVSRKIEEIDAGGDNDVVYKVPGKISYTNLILKRGLVDSKSKIWTWVDSILGEHLEYPIKKHNIMVTLLSPTKIEPLVTWEFKDAYPCKWSISGFESDKNAYSVESMEFAYKSFKKTIY
jgi:phage tail-like protein